MGTVLSWLFWILVFVFIVRACSSSDDYEYSDYDRGYEDGWMEVCRDVRQISPDFYRTLRNRKTC
jgi:hypothetical protein